MKQAIFHNFTDKPFVGHWNGKPYTFKPGFKKEMQATIAAHFAKHLTNQELLKKGGEFENYTSPKKPEAVPAFMEFFNKAYIPLQEQVDEIGLIPDPVMGYERNGEPSMNINVRQRADIDPYDAAAQPVTGPGGKPQVVGEIVDGDDETEYQDEAGKSEAAGEGE